MLTNLIWGLGVQKESSAYPTSQIFYRPHLRLFWKTPSEIPRHRPLWMKFLSCSGRRGRYCTLEAMPLCLEETKKQKVRAKMGGLECVQGLEACCSIIRCFRSLKSCAWTCFLDLQRGRQLSEREVGEKCSEKRNPQPAVIYCENMKECGDIIGRPILSTYMTTEITNVARYSS